MLLISNNVLARITLSVVLLSVTVSSCGTNCCGESVDCCKQSNCQTTTNCCQTVKSCCQAQAYCHQKTTSNCCKKVENCCNTSQDEFVTTSTTYGTPTVNYKHIVIPEKGDNRNTDNNNINLTGSVIINNNISHENRVHIPVTVSNTNLNNIVITPVENAPSSSIITVTPLPTVVKVISLETTTPYTYLPTPAASPPPPIPVTIKVPILVPFPNPTQEPILPQTSFPISHYPFSYPLIQPIPGCCTTFTPCFSHGCNSYHRTCGSECSHPFMYRPVNPCEGQCYRKQFAFNRRCSLPGYCYYHFVDCSQCNEDFYQSYESYQLCGGCFYR